MPLTISPVKPVSPSKTPIESGSHDSHTIHKANQRAVDELRARVQQALLKIAGQSLRAVDVQIHEGLVRLSGQVLSYYQKQLATAAVLSVDGVEQLQNDLKVATGRAPHAHS